jgi:hypothetical protein
MKTGILLLIAMVVGCIESTVYVCPDSSTAKSPSDCPMAPTTTIMAKTVADINCSSFRSSDGKPDIALIRRCQLHLTPSVEFCDNLGDETEFGSTDCLTELASILNSTMPCGSLIGNSKIICEASALGDFGSCDRIPLQESRERCQETIMRHKQVLRPLQNCSGLAGGEFVWCVAYGAKVQDECLRIDEAKYPDEAMFCRSRVFQNQSMCGGIGDNIIENLCRRTIMGI